MRKKKNGANYNIIVETCSNGYSSTNILTKAALVYKEYKMMYEAGIGFVEDSLFKKKLSPRKLLKLWGCDKINKLWAVHSNYFYDSSKDKY